MEDRNWPTDQELTSQQVCPEEAVAPIRDVPHHTENIKGVLAAGITCLELADRYGLLNNPYYVQIMRPCTPESGCRLIADLAEDVVRGRNIRF